MNQRLNNLDLESLFYLTLTLVLLALAQSEVVGGTTLAMNDVTVDIARESPPSPDALRVAVILARQPGCERSAVSAADVGLVVNESRRVNLDPAVVAAVIAVESHCDPTAVDHRRGRAVGWMQVNLDAWSGALAGPADNPFNKAVSVRVGARILSGYVRRYGLRGGLARYHGLGSDGFTTDGVYVERVLRAAGVGVER